MLYLKNITTAQALMIPRLTEEDPGRLTLTIKNTVDKSVTFAGEVKDLRVFESFYNVALVLPEGVPAGEFEYELNGDKGLLSSGLVEIREAGEFTQYQKNVEYEQYK